MESKIGFRPSFQGQMTITTVKNIGGKLVEEIQSFTTTPLHDKFIKNTSSAILKSEIGKATTISKYGASFFSMAVEAVTGKKLLNTEGVKYLENHFDRFVSYGDYSVNKADGYEHVFVDFTV